MSRSSGWCHCSHKACFYPAGTCHAVTLQTSDFLLSLCSMNTGLRYESILPLIPGKPGIYQFIDAYGNIIYIGKAKNLRKRVASYFAKNQSGKTSVMLRKAADIRHIVVDNE